MLTVSKSVLSDPVYAYAVALVSTRNQVSLVLTPDVHQRQCIGLVSGAGQVYRPTLTRDAYSVQAVCHLFLVLVLLHKKSPTGRGNSRANGLATVA